MFPLLPALILLLLNAPAGMDRLEADGRLPAVLAALQHQIDAKAGRSSDELALASLLALGSDPDVAEVLVRYLAAKATEAEPLACEPTSRTSDASPEAPWSVGKPRQGIATAERSRDGPNSR